MSLQTFEIESLDQIDDGSVSVALNKAIRAAYMDCIDRPELGKARKIAFVIGLTPTMDKGEIRYVHVAFNIQKTFPPQGVEVVMKPGGDGLEFQPAIPDNPDQKPLPFEEK